MARFFAYQGLAPRSSAVLAYAAAYLELTVGAEQHAGFHADFRIVGLVGGVLIDFAGALLMLLDRRIGGVSGVFAGLLSPNRSDRDCRLSFLRECTTTKRAAPPSGAAQVPSFLRTGLIRSNRGRMIKCGISPRA